LRPQRKGDARPQEKTGEARKRGAVAFSSCWRETASNGRKRERASAIDCRQAGVNVSKKGISVYKTRERKIPRFAFGRIGKERRM